VPTEILAATAASPWDDVVVRACVFLVVCKWRTLSPLLSGSAFAFLVCAYQVAVVDAY
nr:protein p7 [Hepacivirus P]